MPYHTENAKLIMAVCGMLMMFSSCAFFEHPVLVLGIWVVCGVVGFVMLAWGTNEKGIALNAEMSRKKRGLSEEEQARDAVAGAMFMDGDDLLG